MTKKPVEYRFACTQCGACCTGSDAHYIEVSRDEQQAISQFLDISERWLRRRYITRYDSAIDSIKIVPDGHCSFLSPEGRCQIYPVRPQQCRSYPFWPEIVVNASSWRAEARHCEGIGQGKLIAASRIEDILRRDKAG